MLKNKRVLRLRSMVRYLNNILLFLTQYSKKFIYYYNLNYNYVIKYSIKTNFKRAGDSLK